MELRNWGFEELDKTVLENLCGLGRDAVVVGLNLENLKTETEAMA